MVKKKVLVKGGAQKTKTVTPRAIVGIGASAGGLEAITELLANLPQKTGMAFVYVQHLDPTHKSLLTAILSRVSTIDVQEAKQGTRVVADNLYVIPPGKNMFIEKGVLRLVSRVGGEGRLVSIDNFFRSLAADQKNRSIGIILSGNASDGVLGLEAIKGEGGITFAQEEKSARHPSMPHSAIESGAADQALVPADIAKELGRISRHPLVTSRAGKSQNTEGIASARVFGEKEQVSLEKVFAILRVRTGVNFLRYKAPTLRRRMDRRMLLHKLESLSSYVTFLQDTPPEIDALFQDLLINVTGFFRDRNAFDYLKRHVFPLIIKEHGKDEPLRFWSAGCSTGEEAYSLAMSLVEFLDSSSRKIPFQIFGSDLSETNIAKARAGIYPTSIATDVSPERLRRFFTKVDGHYQISKSIRDMCIFAKQDLVNDPPFSQLDLITCRNVLIYLEADAQKRILSTFHYALKPTGYLMLGKSEGVGEFTDLFSIKHKAHKVYGKKASTRKRFFNAFADDDSKVSEYNPDVREKASEQNHSKSLSPNLDGELSKNVDQILLSSGFVPPSVVIDEGMQILQFRGHLAPYLDFPTGKATWNLLKMAQDSLVMELRGAVTDAKKKQKTVLRNDVTLMHNGRARAVTIEVIPLKRQFGGERHFLIVFRRAESQTMPEVSTRDGASHGTKKSTDRAIEKIERELAVTKEHLRTALEEEESAREEFQSVNEEVVSSNEELQSTNEELETAKEELQSTNEELVTVNEELQTRNSELSQINNDLSNVLSSANVPIIIVDRELRIRRLTPIAEKSLRILPIDIGRSITDIKLPIHFPNLRELLTEVIESVQPRHEVVKDEENRWYTLWVRPYKTWDNKIDGAIITLIDINDVKQGQAKLEQALSYAQGILSTMREPLLVLDKDMRVKSANRAFYEMFHISEKDTTGIRLYDLGGGHWNKPQLRDAMEKISPTQSSFRSLEIAFDFENIGPRVLCLNGHKLIQSEGVEELILLAMEDITNHRLLQERNDTFVSMASHELKTPVTTVKTLVQILQKRFEASDDKMLLEYLSRMGKQIDQLSGLVTDLLDISKIRTGKFEIYEGAFDIEALVKDIVETYQLLSPNHAIKFEGEVHVKAKGDHDRIGQVLINLLVNAIKYSPKADEIIVRLAANDREVTVSVQDFGIGIKKDHQNKIFERFFQVGNKVGQNFSGLGMGLYISAGIIERHGGRIWVESNGKGSTFFFTLPIQEETSAKKNADKA